MTFPNSPAGSRQAAVDAAAPRGRAGVPTFAEYVPIGSGAVSDGTRKAYGTYWNRVVEQWGRQLMTLVKAGACTGMPRTTDDGRPQDLGRDAHGRRARQP
jgi:hypothetical protein